MERKDEAAVERQKLVDDGEVENDDEQTNIASNIPPPAPKTVQSPSSPVLSNRVSLRYRILMQCDCLKAFMSDMSVCVLRTLFWVCHQISWIFYYLKFADIFQR